MYSESADADFFASQTKHKLVSSEVRPVVESAINTGLDQWLEENPKDLSLIHI